MPARPVEPYGQSKLDAESIVTAQSEVPVVVVRPAAVYGPGDRDFLALFRLAKHGIAVHPANRDHWISIVHVADVADAVLRAATARMDQGRAFFIANDAPVQWSELFRLGAECAGTTLHVDANLPQLAVETGAMIGDLAARITGHASLMTSGKTALSRERFWVCSNDRARRELSFVPQVDLQTGMRETYAWYQMNRWL